MKNVKKIVIFVLLWILFVQNSFFGIVFAQTTEEFAPISDDMGNEDDGVCRTCTMPSLEFQTYVNFQVELLQILQKALKEKEENKKPKNIWLFSAGILKLPSNLIKSWVGMLKKGAKELTEWYRTVKMWAIMLWSITTELVSKDSVWGLKILFRNETFVREWTTLQDLDMSIHDAMRDLWMKWIWDDSISNDIAVEIWKLKSKYIKNKGNELWLFEKFDMDWDVKYKDIVNLMLKLNAVMKMFVSNYSNMVSSHSFKIFLWKISDDISKWNITMKFNIDLMGDMADHYKCAVWVSACSSMWKDFANNTKIWAQIKKWLTDSLDIIKKANENFTKAMFGFGGSVKDTSNSKKENNELWLTAKQLTLLRTVYGIDTTKLSKEQWIGLESLLNGSAGKKIVNSVDLKSLDYFSVESQKAKEEAKKLADREKEDARYLSSLSTSETEKAKKKWEAERIKREDEMTYDSKKMSTNLMSTLDVVLMQKKEDKKVFMIYSNLAITRYFVEIWLLIHDILESSIWTKDSKWLIKYLWESCEAQCSNKGTRNCYAR